jgi:7-cyano-7-deazaguanine synthase
VTPTVDERRALVLFSGGQDSTVCLAWALERHAHVETAGFDYGQRHRIELDARGPIRDGLAALQPAWAARLRGDHLLDLSVLAALSDSALLHSRAIEMQANNLPNTFVPGRNLMFLVAAAALAYRRGIDVLVGGMCETDYSGYPDCRDATLRSMQQTLRLGMDTGVEIATPLMFIDKAATWALAQRLGGDALVELVVEQTHTCYLGERGARHAWGYGCGRCPACVLRARGHAAFMAQRRGEAATGKSA